MQGGQHIGITPFGYVRKYSERIGGVDAAMVRLNAALDVLRTGQRRAS